MREWKEVKEIKEVKEVKEKTPTVAAFFDLDGTLMPLPSLERRFFRTLRYRVEIPLRNYWLWLREAARLAPRGISAVTQANKMYLKGVQSLNGGDEANQNNFPGNTDGHPSGFSASWNEGQASARPSEMSTKRARSNPRLPVSRFFREGVERVAWHAKQGHVIVLVTGTLEPLAGAAALTLMLRLATSEIPASIAVCATRLEETDARWTGRILGDAMFGKAKGRAAERIAAEMNLDLSQCYAYGDAANDRWLLEAVGNPVAVNPSRPLARMARKRGWAILRWDEEKELTQSAQSSQRAQNKERKEGKQEAGAGQSLLREDLREIRERVLQAVRWI